MAAQPDVRLSLKNAVAREDIFQKLAAPEFRASGALALRFLKRHG